MSSQTNVVSFIVRFVQSTMIDATTDPPQTDWHGVVKHVQSNTEQHFTHFSDAVAFIANYVSLNDVTQTKDTESRLTDSG